MNLKSVDVSLVLYMMERASQPSSRRRYLWMSKSGDGWLSVTVLISHIIYNTATQLFIAALTGVAVERSLYWAIKNTARRRRPPQAIPGMRPIIIAHDKFSLPSGHTSAAFMLITFLTLEFSPLWGFGYIWAMGVGVARVGLGVHFPSDICAGALLGTCVAITTSVTFS
ncbi:phosphatase PAP2 family protein [Microbulbifer sp. SSSA007]|uniref:phosphatase PAP2 family protein n=1 Tax=Microbulbifer TaxID=48073 RepID=UPI0003762973|nr:phosphatase PAP2 family protein [Microbulbifer variabilis]